MNKKITTTLAVCGLLALGAVAQAQINGAGATFPALLYQKWAQEYKNSGGGQVNYQSIGSSGGVKNITAKTVDFGASDGPMTAAELQKAPGVLHIPMCVGAVVPAYNIPGAANGLKLTGPVIADIYLGKISKWNDPAIGALNPGVTLPAMNIVPAFRSDGSGTTAIFTHYMCQVNPSFESGIGEGKAVRWPKGVGGKGNEGVAALVKQTPGGFGYIEAAYAEKNNINFATVQNKSGKFVRASIKSTSEAAASARLPSDFRFIITNTSDPEGYAIAGFTWILAYPDAKPEVKKFLKWCLTDGQKSAAKHDYAPLPESVRVRALKAIEVLK